MAHIVAGIKVVGKAKVGRTLKLKNLAISFRGTVDYKVKWFAGKNAIKMATNKSRLTITRTMRGKLIKVKVTAIAGTVKQTRTIKVSRAR